MNLRLGLGAVVLVFCYPGARASETDAGSPAGKGAEALRDEGVRHYEARRYFDAARAFEAALEAAQGAQERALLEELLARSLSAHGVELFNAGESRTAEKAFRDALGHHEDFYAHFGLGFLSLVRLQDAEAAGHLNRVLVLEPKYQRAHKLLALLDYRKGSVDSALNRMEEAYRLDRADTEAKDLLERWRTEAKHSRDFVEEVRGAFLVRADPAIPKERILKVMGLLEKLRHEIGEALLVTSSRRIVVVLFNEAEFHQATGSFHWVGGLYDGQLKLPLPVADSAAKESSGLRDLSNLPSLPNLEETLRHELTHVLVREICPECPNWLNEGIAQHFEKKGRGATAESALSTARQKRIPLTAIPARLWEVKDEETARLAYLESLSFVEFLVEAYGEFRLSLLLESLTLKGSVTGAFAAIYGAELEKVEGAWCEKVEARPASGKN